MTALLVASLAGAGVHLLVSAAVGGPRARTPQLTDTVSRWLSQAGIDGVRPTELVAACTLAATVVAALAFALFGGAVAPLAAGAFAASAPVASARARRARRRALAREAWPAIVDEVRVRATAGGRSVPQALFEAGESGPAELRDAFAEAQRAWLLTRDFERATVVLKARLADASADAVCETMLIAHDVGGTDIGRRLAALAEDRLVDAQGRRDATAKQAGVRFARRFVLGVPVGMALAGLSIGDGRASYATGGGQLAVAFGVAVLAACWWWSGRLMRLPDEERVFQS